MGNFQISMFCMLICIYQYYFCTVEILIGCVCAQELYYAAPMLNYAMSCNSYDQRAVWEWLSLVSRTRGTLPWADTNP